MVGLATLMLMLSRERSMTQEVPSQDPDHIPEPEEDQPSLDPLVVFSALHKAGAVFGLIDYQVEELTEAVMAAIKEDTESMSE